jgi:glyoxylase-like metal-dependent hydrolase (beta-lactamase superfamily II)/rhodanese-related sulfurtransferase
MEIEQFYLGCLAHASYLIASDGVAAIVDPQRDIEIYLDAARKRNVRIEHVIETHLHADFVSGHHELAERTGARIYLGARAGASFPHVAVHDGDGITLGSIKLTFLETPGHTLESICILVGDLNRSSEPVAVLTGDTLFIGDVGRPDLGPGYTPQELAGMLYDSIHSKLLTLPDPVAVYPAHGAGSLCGRNLSADRSSTIGREKATNYALRAVSREEFVALLTAELQDRPEYFLRDVEINRRGAPALTQLKPLAPLPPDDVLGEIERGAIVLDVRDEDAFGAAHVPGSINIGLDGQFASWVGSMLGLDVDIIIVAADDEAAAQVHVRLARVGIERVIGYLAGGIGAWREGGKSVARTPQLDPPQLRTLLEQGRIDQLVDVRRPAEWEGGVIGPALLRPLNRLSQALDDLDKSRPTVVYCKSGYRSSIAVGILEREGFANVSNTRGGFDAWKEAGLAIEARPSP